MAIIGIIVNLPAKLAIIHTIFKPALDKKRKKKEFVTCAHILSVKLVYNGN
jgi:hypothetical protein